MGLGALFNIVSPNSFESFNLIPPNANLCPGFNRNEISKRAISLSLLSKKY